MNQERCKHVVRAELVRVGRACILANADDRHHLVEYCETLVTELAEALLCPDCSPLDEQIQEGELPEYLETLRKDLRQLLEAT